MRVRGASGVWEIFIPGVGEGEHYKFEIRTRQGAILVKSDPYAFYTEFRPKTANIVHDINKYRWSDKKWMDKRKKINQREKPITIYEVHLGSWMRVMEENNRFLTYREMAPKLVEYVKEMGFTHLELLPIAEHPLDASWGYQVTQYFAPTSRFGSPEDFMYLVDLCHQNNIGVIVDWVAGHFPKDGHGLMQFDGSCLYEHADPRQGEHADWGTLIFNYGRNEVRNFLLSNLLFWLDKYHIDGIRVDAVASMLYHDYSRKEGEWIPNKYGGRENLEAIDFLKEMNKVAHNYYPGMLSFAEESTSWPGVSHPTYLGGLGFGYKWNMGWMNDILEYFSQDPLFRKYNHNNLTFAMLYAFHENFVLVLSHDEVVHGKRSLLDKMPGEGWEKFANLRLLFGYMYSQPGKKLLFMGGEFGHGVEWNFDQSLDWHLLDRECHSKLQRYVKDLNRLYKKEKAFWEVDFDWTGFEWIDFHDWENSTITFIRRSKDPNTALAFPIIAITRKSSTVIQQNTGERTSGTLVGWIRRKSPIMADPIPWK
jgi:1,4-alpha-glucan branching enzyme